MGKPPKVRRKKAPPRRRRAGGEDEAGAAPAAEPSGEPEVEVVQVAEGREEAVSAWASLSREEKAEVLEVSPRELRRRLVDGGLEPEDAEAVLDVLDQPELMTAVRACFVGGMATGGLFAMPVAPVSVALVRVMEAHLLLAHARRVYMFKLPWLLALVAWFVLDWHWALRGPLAAAALALTAASPAPARAAVELFLLPFDDGDARRMTAHVDAFCGALITASLSWWAPWRRVAVLASYVPLGLVLLERALSRCLSDDGSLDDRKALVYVRTGMLGVAHFFMLYFCLYSWTGAAAFAFYMLPTLSRYAVGAAAIGAHFALRGGMFVRDLVGDRVPRPGGALGHGVLLLALAWSLWTGFFGERRDAFYAQLVALLALVPDALVNGVFNVVSIAGGVLLSKRLDTHTVLQFSLLGLVFGLAGLRAVWVAGRRCCGRGAPRGSDQQQQQQQQEQPQF